MRAIDGGASLPVQLEPAAGQTEDQHTTMEQMELDAWITRQTVYSMSAMEQAISATHLRRRRDIIGQVLNPIAGSVLASPVIADWNPEPDYFFHWLRDSAIVMRTVAELFEDASSSSERQRWGQYFDDFVRFSLLLARLDGASSAPAPVPASPASSQFLRPEAEIRSLVGDALLGEPRFNPDGTIDIFHWSRPQYDGPALRALACLRYLVAGGIRSDQIAELLRLDLDFTARHAGHPCVGPWEEPDQPGLHYYVELVQLGALVHGRAWSHGAESRWRAAEQTLRDRLEQHWSDRHHVFAALIPEAADSPDDLLDASTLLAVWDADLPDGPHSVFDARVHDTQAAIESLFARELPINRHRSCAPALGRSRRDRYFGGGAWYPTTLAAAGLCYRRALGSLPDRPTQFERGDGFMTTLRELIPADGALSEQVDRTTGVQRSARHLTWSYAAFISTARLRARVVAEL
jgi:glucoamylase